MSREILPGIAASRDARQKHRGVCYRMPFGTLRRPPCLAVDRGLAQNIEPMSAFAFLEDGYVGPSPAVLDSGRAPRPVRRALNRP